MALRVESSCSSTGLNSCRISPFTWSEGGRRKSLLPHSRSKSNLLFFHIDPAPRSTTSSDANNYWSAFATDLPSTLVYLPTLPSSISLASKIPAFSLIIASRRNHHNGQIEVSTCTPFMSFCKVAHLFSHSPRPPAHDQIKTSRFLVAFYENLNDGLKWNDW